MLDFGCGNLVLVPMKTEPFKNRLEKQPRVSLKIMRIQNYRNQTPFIITQR